MSDDKKKLFEQVMRASVHRVVQRMRTLGFWPADQGLPPDPPDEAQERGALEAERVRLLALAHGEVDFDQALRAEHQRRILAAREKRKQRQLERDQARQKRRDKWATVRALGIVHAGAEVSAGLNATQSDEAALLSRGIPILHTPADVARFLAIELGQLRFLTFHRRGAAVVHYRRYEIPKKTGGVRRISAPKPRLASAQQKVFHDILERLTVEPEAHGFVKARSIVTNALPHVGKRVVANLDLKDFFPTVTFRRVKGLFAKLGYSESVATVLSLLLTEPPRQEVFADGRRLWVALGQRVLPQGACTSPVITNLLCRGLDRRLHGLARSHGYTYTRYADDLTFSGDDKDRIGTLLAQVRRILDAEGFAVNEAKTRVMGRGRRQEVTGVVVNQKATVARDEVRKLRALLHQAARDGLASQNRDGHPDFRAHVHGRIAFVRMVDRDKGDKLMAQLDRLR